jgi:hypothetical protein
VLNSIADAKAVLVADHTLHAMEYKDTWRLVRMYKISMLTVMQLALHVAIVQEDAA